MPRMTYDERADRFDADLAAAVAAHDSDHALLALLSRPRLDGRERVLIIAALWRIRDRPGRLGGGARTVQPCDERTRHRHQVHPGELARQCLRRRDSPRPAGRPGGHRRVPGGHRLDQPDRCVDYGLDALAFEGDDRGWNSMVAFISEILSRKTISATRWNELIMAVEYLARTPPSAAPARNS